MSSNWWTTSDGEDLSKSATGKYDVGGGDFELLPQNTRAIASIVSAAWVKDRDGNRYINIQWSVVRHEGYANRRVFQKIWCADFDPRAEDPEKKRDKAKKMLVNIDLNAGGKMLKAGREPDDDDLALALTNKQMGIVVRIWDKEDGGVKTPGGNYVSAVEPKSGFEPTVPPKAVPKREAGRNAPPPADDDDSDIPF